MAGSLKCVCYLYNLYNGDMETNLQMSQEVRVHINDSHLCNIDMKYNLQMFPETEASSLKIASLKQQNSLVYTRLGPCLYINGRESSVSRLLQAANSRQYKQLIPFSKT